MQETLQQPVASIQERYGAAALYASTMLTLADMVSHLHVFFANPEPLWKTYPFRQSIPIITEQIGNAGPSIAVVFFGTLIGNEVRLYAERTGKERLTHIAEKALPISTIAAIGLNVVSEWGAVLHENIRKENMLDLGFGIFCVGLGVLAAQYFKNNCPDGMWRSLSEYTPGSHVMVQYFNNYYVR